MTRQKENFSTRYLKASKPLRNFQIFVLCFSVAAGCQSSFAQENQQPSAAFQEYRTFLWNSDGRKGGPELFKTLIAEGVSGTNVAGLDDSSSHARHQAAFYLDHAAGKGFLYLRESEWQPLYETWRKSLTLPGLARPRPIDSPQAVAQAKKRIDQVLAGALKHRPVAISLDDEIALGRRNYPIDMGFSPYSLQSFRRWLQQRYANPKTLSRAWDTKVSPFATLLPLTTHEIRRREFLKPARQHNFAAWSEHRAFLDENMAARVQALARYVRSQAGTIPVGFSGGEAPHSFSGIDWYLMSRELDFLEPYDSGGSRELLRSFASPNTLFARTIFRDNRHPLANVHELWDYFLRGDRISILWSSKEYFAAQDSLELSPWAKSLSPTLRSLAAKDLAGFRRSRALTARIAVVEAAPANRLHWLHDSWGDGRSWIHRLGSYERDHSSQNATREAWQKILEDLQLDYFHLDARELKRQNLVDVDVVVLPRCIALSDQQVKILREFARTKTLIADAQLALFDEKLRARKTGPLDDLFGIQRDNRIVNLREIHFVGKRDTLRPEFLLAEPGLRTRPQVASTLAISERPTMIIRQHGKTGRTIYLNLLLHEYCRLRTSNRHDKILSEMRGIFRITGVRPRAELRALENQHPPVRMFRREDKDHEWLALLYNWRSSFARQTPAELAKLKPVQLEVLLPKAVEIERVFPPAIEQSHSSSRPKRSSSLRCVLGPFEPLIFKLKKKENVRNR